MGDRFEGETAAMGFKVNDSMVLALLPALHKSRRLVGSREPGRGGKESERCRRPARPSPASEVSAEVEGRVERGRGVTVGGRTLSRRGGPGSSLGWC
eukprot:3498498-Rhodomonas_salina.2